MNVEHWDAAVTTARAEELGRLLADTVSSGASVGFLSPLDRDHAWAYWVEVARSVAAGTVQLLVVLQGEELVGAVQLYPAQQPTALHRAEVANLMVRSVYRQKGFGRKLMLAVHEWGRAYSRTTLVLATRTGDRSERLFQSLGWVKSGEVPLYARSADGSLHTTSYYHLILSAAPA